MTRARSLAAVVVSLGIVLGRPSLAAFHIAQIDEVMSGAGGNANVQYVEIRMLFGGQNLVARSRLTAFSCAPGNPSTVLLLVPSNVSVGLSGRRWIMGSPDNGTFSAASGLTPDFPFSPGIPPSCGMVCWGAPVDPNNEPPANPSSWSASDPNNYVDCVAYGGYAGPKPSFAATASATPGDGTFSLTRDSGTGDFGLACPSPTNNPNTMGGFGPCSPPTSTTSTSLPTTTSTSTSTTSSTLPAGLPPAVSGGRPRKTDCFAEWRVVGAAGTRPVVTCTDGDGACDKGDGPGCFFQMVLCLNDTANAIYKGKCSVGPISSFALTSKVRNTVDASNASAMLGAVAALGGTLSTDGATVTFAAPITNLRCTDPFNLMVLPKVVGGKPRKGVRVLRTRITAGKADKDALRLICVP